MTSSISLRKQRTNIYNDNGSSYTEKGPLERRTHIMVKNTDLKNSQDREHNYSHIVCE